MEETLINKVQNSGLISLDLEDWYPEGERVVYDLKQNLYMELILKEKEFRAFLKDNDWSYYKDKHVAICCTADAIVPTWAYMLLATYLSPFASTVIFGDLEALELNLFQKVFNEIDFEKYRDQRVVVKGCSKIKIPTSVYVAFTNLLKPKIKSLMFGEACSTVPLYKAKPNA
jgi:hypothetical protein